jgi:hypothetical protein
MKPAQTTQHLACSVTGTLHAVLVFFEMELSPDVMVSNGLCSGGHWGRTAFLLDPPTAALPGDMVPVTAQHDTSQFSLSVGKTAAIPTDTDQPLSRMNQTGDGMGIRTDIGTGGRDPVVSPIPATHDAIIQNDTEKFKRLSA